MHAELLYYWLSASGLPAPQNVEIHTVPPPMMADAMAAGEIDAFCVGEPWGSHAVEIGAASLLLTGRAIWSAAPEKVLAVRSDWAEENPGLTGRLMRAIWRGCRWLSESGVETTAAELLAQDKYLGVAPEIIDRALRGRFVISPSGEVRPAPGFMSFYEGAANFPWRSQAAWIGHQMAARLGLDREASVRAACEVFRTDLYRLHMRDSGATLPGASSKIEGGCAPGTAAASETGRLFLPENRFFDSRVFDPAGFD